MSVGAGGAPSTPAATCRFCSRIASHDVGGSHLPRGKFVGIDPDSHAVFASTEDLSVADTGDPGQPVPHLQVREVRQVQHVVARVGRHQMDQHQEIGRRLLGHDADALHFLREARQCLRDPVLDLHLRVIEIGAERKGRSQCHHAVGGRLRIHVEQTFDAIDLVFERRGDCFGDDFRIGTRIDTAHHDGRRHHAGISLIGNATSAMPPPTTIRSDSTMAKIGRSMKKCESFMTAAPPSHQRPLPLERS